MNNKIAIVNRYKDLLEREGVEVNDEEIEDIVNNSDDEARQSYAKLSSPLLSIDLYISHWLRESLDKYFITKTIKKVTHINSDPLVLKTNDFITTFPPNLQEKYIAQLSSEPSNQRRKLIWNEGVVPFVQIERKFNDLLLARNVRANEKGFDNYIDQTMDYFRIPTNELSIFKNNIDEVISFCNSKLPKEYMNNDSFSEYSQPCYLCNVLFKEISFPEGVFDIIANIYPELKGLRDKVSINLGNSSNMMYRKEDDKFEITIDSKLDYRYRTVDLIHELGHVITQFKEYKAGHEPLALGKFHEEKINSEFQLTALRKVSIDMYKAFYGEILLLIHRLLFELTIYIDPDQELSKLYASIFNRCFNGADLQESHLFLLDKAIIFRPLSSIPQTFALANYIFNNLAIL